MTASGCAFGTRSLGAPSTRARAKVGWQARATSAVRPASQWDRGSRLAESERASMLKPVVVLLAAAMMSGCGIAGDRDASVGNRAPVLAAHPSGTAQREVGEASDTCRTSRTGARLRPADSPQAVVAAYVRCLNAGDRHAAQSLWVDVGVPRPGSRVQFEPTASSCPASRDGMGMGTANFEFIVALPGTYSLRSPEGETTGPEQATFVLLRASGSELWSILSVDTPGQAC